MFQYSSHNTQGSKGYASEERLGYRYNQVVYNYTFALVKSRTGSLCSELQRPYVRVLARGDQSDERRASDEDVHSLQTPAPLLLHIGTAAIANILAAVTEGARDLLAVHGRELLVLEL